jgi:hypothetical protein
MIWVRILEHVFQKTEINVLLSIIGGLSFFGKVDHVPGLFHVATRFGHLFFIPIVPAGSFLVIQGSGTQRQTESVLGTTTRASTSVQPLPFSWKSLLFAWLRLALLLVLVLAVSIFLLALPSGHHSMLTTGAIALAAATCVYQESKSERIDDEVRPR